MIRPRRRSELIAQDVNKIVPEVVSDGEYLGMNYGELVPVLISAIQEQQKTIEKLEKEVGQLGYRESGAAAVESRGIGDPENAGST